MLNSMHVVNIINFHNVTVFITKFYNRLDLIVVDFISVSRSKVQVIQHFFFLLLDDIRISFLFWSVDQWQNMY